MTIDDDDTTTGGRLAGDTIEIKRNGRTVEKFTLPMTLRQKLAIIRKVWSML